MEVKKKIIEIMETLDINESKTFDQLEKDCLARLCGNLEEIDEKQCNVLIEKVKEYDALEKNKKMYFDAIQTRIENIWSKEDGEIFDNVYLNTDLYDQKQINDSLEFIKQKGRTSSAEKYITALEMSNEKNIKKAKKYQKKSTKVFNIIGIVLILTGIACLFWDWRFSFIAIPGILLKIQHHGRKKMWNILTIEETQFHNMVLIDGSVAAISNSNADSQNDEIRKMVTDTLAKSAEEKEIQNQKQMAENKNVSSEDLSDNVNQSQTTMVQQIDDTESKKIKKGDQFELVSLICGIIAFPMLITILLWFPVWVCAIVFGVIPLCYKTRKKGMAITGLVLSGIFLIFFMVLMMYSLSLPEDETNYTSQIKIEQYHQADNILNQNILDMNL